MSDMSREVVVEGLNRGDVLEVDLDAFAAEDDGKCGCAPCLALRGALADGVRGTILLTVAPGVEGKVE